MAEKEVIQALGFFEGQTSKGNFDIKFKMSFRENEIGNALQFVATIGKEIAILAVVNDNDKVKLGKFSVYKVTVDKNLNCKVEFKSNINDCFVGNFERLMVDEATILLKCKVSE